MVLYGSISRFPRHRLKIKAAGFFMKKKNRYKEKLVTALEVPDDLAYSAPILTVTGKNLAVIENYRGILRYTREEIVVLTFQGRLTICGRHLEIPCFTREEMQIKGYISRIILE